MFLIKSIFLINLTVTKSSKTPSFFLRVTDKLFSQLSSSINYFITLPSSPPSGLIVQTPKKRKLQNNERIHLRDERATFKCCITKEVEDERETGEDSKNLFMENINK